MPKFYVHSCSLQLITTATDPRAAAIWAVHRTLSPSLPFLSGTEPDASPNTHLPKPYLGEMIEVSERGFGSAESHELDTLGIVTEWSQLLLAVDRLQKRLAVH
jgi:hypothetical protein